MNYDKHWFSSKEAISTGKIRFYRIFNGIKRRCNNIKTKDYKYYWLYWITYEPRRERFKNFKDDMYESYLEHVKIYWEKQTTIDRYPDQKWNYCKENCRWATYSEQIDNRDCWFGYSKELKILKQKYIKMKSSTHSV